MLNYERKSKSKNKIVALGLEPRIFICSTDSSVHMGTTDDRLALNMRLIVEDATS